MHGFPYAACLLALTAALEACNGTTTPPLAALEDAAVDASVASLPTIPATPLPDASPTDSHVAAVDAAAVDAAGDPLPAEQLDAERRELCKMLRGGLSGDFPEAAAHLCDRTFRPCKGRAEAACRASAACLFTPEMTCFPGTKDCPAERCDEMPTSALVKSIHGLAQCRKTSGHWFNRDTAVDGECECYGTPTRPVTYVATRGCVPARTLCQEGHHHWHEATAVDSFVEAETCVPDGVHAFASAMAPGQDVCTIDHAYPRDIACDQALQRAYERQGQLLAVKRGKNLVACTRIAPEEKGSTPRRRPSCEDDAGKRVP